MLNTISFQLPAALTHAVDVRMSGALADRLAQRIWQRDASVWTSADEARWLGWLQAPHVAVSELATYTAFADEVRALGLGHVLLIGMGGSSLAPEVLSRMLAAPAGAPQLLVLDSTHPDQIRATDDAVDASRTLVIVSSKSGSTLETKLLGDYWHARLVERLGAERGGQRMVAITDPGSQLESFAREHRFGRVFAGEPSIGGRFSALSPFGLVPSAAAGHDVHGLLAAAIAMADACHAEDRSNPGLMLGAVLGEAVHAGHDKLTLVSSARTRSLGAWLEQLLAESTGKKGTAIVPIDMEPLQAVKRYANDRLFVQIALEGEHDAACEGELAALVSSGHPVVRIRLRSPTAVSQEFFRWEFATAVAGAILGVNPFDQPDVEASKVATRQAMAARKASGQADPLKSAQVSAAGDFELRGLGGVSADGTEAALIRFFNETRSGDYIAVLAYIAMNQANSAALARFGDALRARFGLPVSIQFGPRFLHSTGQAHKGGPNSGLFLVLTDTPRTDLAAPGIETTFGVVIGAQALGDASVLVERGRRVLSVHLGGDAPSGIEALRTCIEAAIPKP